MQIRRRSFPLACAACAIAALPLLAQPEHASGPDRRASRAGDVAQNPAQPPPGPISPTDRIRLHKDSITLPFVINQPGSYVLTSDLTGVPGEDGLIITASDVTIDLNGFTLRGVQGSHDGIAASDAAGVPERIVVSGGAVTGWGDWGVNLVAGLTARVERVIATDNGSGIVAPQSSLVASCQAAGNAGNGIVADARSIVRDCISNSNAGTGIRVFPGSKVTGSTADLNGVFGIEALASSTLDDCVVTRNASHGVSLSGDCTVRGVTSDRNGGRGISAFGPCTILDSTVTNNEEVGVRCTQLGRIVNCEISNNRLNGVLLGQNSTLLDSRLMDNALGGGGNVAVSAIRQCTIIDTEVSRTDASPSSGPRTRVDVGMNSAVRGCAFSGVDVTGASSNFESNRFLRTATLTASGPGVAPIVDSIADAGPHDNIRLPN